MSGKAPGMRGRSPVCMQTIISGYHCPKEVCLQGLTSFRPSPPDEVVVLRYLDKAILESSSISGYTHCALEEPAGL